MVQVDCWSGKLFCFLTQATNTFTATICFCIYQPLSVTNYENFSEIMNDLQYNRCEIYTYSILCIIYVEIICFQIICFCLCIHLKTNYFLIYRVLYHILRLSLIMKNDKNIFNKNGKRCRDVKTKKACKQGWEVNVVPKIKQTTSI